MNSQLNDFIRQPITKLFQTFEMSGLFNVYPKSEIVNSFTEAIAKAKGSQRKKITVINFNTNTSRVYDYNGVPGKLNATGSTIVSVLDFGATGNGITNDAPAMQAALDYVSNFGGGEVTVPDGTFLANTTLEIGSNTKLTLSKFAIIKRNANINALIINKHDGTTGLYGQAHDIEITGGTFHCNKDVYNTQGCNTICFGHSQDIYIHDLKVTDQFGWHCIEINSSKDVTINNVRCYNYDNVTTGKECIQIDLCFLAGFPFFGPYDNTPCQNISISNCVIRDACRGIGSHSGFAGKPHQDIRITNCHFENCREEAIIMTDWKDVIIDNNTFKTCLVGVLGVTEALQSLRNFTISNNKMTDFIPDAANSKAIFISGVDTANRWFKNINIVGNTIRTIERNAITVDFCDNVNITSNQIHNSGRAAIYLFKVTNVNLKGNICRGNNRLVITDYADIVIGAMTNGTLNTDAANIIAESNIIDSMTVVYTYCTVIQIRGNTIRTSYNTIGTKAEHQVAGNYIAGVWVP